MCLALPGLVISIEEAGPGSVPATVRFGSVLREVDLMLVPEAEVGDHVIVHSGFAIRLLPPAEADELSSLLDEAL